MLQNQGINIDISQIQEEFNLAQIIAKRDNLILLLIKEIASLKEELSKLTEKNIKKEK